MAYKIDLYKNRVPILEFPIKLELGGGEFPKDGFINCDFNPIRAQIVWDLTNGIPLPDNSVSELWTSHFFEHIRDDYHYILLEVLRVCQDGAKVSILVPHKDSIEAKIPCHYRYFDEEDFKGLDIWIHRPDWRIRLVNQFRVDYTLHGEFKITKV
jgi:hypothetical protein